MIKKHYAQYGSIIMPRIWCVICKCNTLISAKKKLCCGQIVKKDQRAFKIKKICDNFQRRKGLSASKKKEILDKQKNRCFYCDLLFNTMYYHNKKFLFLRIHFDHFIPFAYLQNDGKDNFVAACNICNGIKGSLMFESKEDIIAYVTYHRKKKRYYFEGEDEMPNLHEGIHINS